MRRNPVSFALTVGMALIVVLFGFTLLSAAGLAGFAADDALAERRDPGEPEGPQLSARPVAAPMPQLTAAQAAEVAAGNALFKGNCAQCHAVNEQVVGPALAGITKRRPISWILPWVKNSSKVVASGDDYAVALFNKFNKQQMPSFALSDKEIASIVAYINLEEGAPVATAATVAVR
ncbi:cytochrome c [Hymenobacter sp. DH14]|uniref:Cytochrome c n=1 Tax=Hymenobacter cyanobacteriorum TaxID=2926463 RepID=A0A9X1VD10_9BACT|nr:cytochrome c [Hymenobacter cyanobacteriorum]MCI1186884.1 cytochrome c [Hymenobacter cyanobacteriorum]